MSRDIPSNQQVEHDLKCWTEFFGAIADGSKPFEIRFNDRGYCVGHRLRLREWDRHAQHYTGREVVKRVTYMTPWMQSENYVVMGLAGETSAALREGDEVEYVDDGDTGVIIGPDPDTRVVVRWKGGHISSPLLRNLRRAVKAPALAETPAELREDAEYYRHNRDVMGAEWDRLRQLLIRFVISWESLPGHENMDRLCEIARGLGCVPSALKTGSAQDGPLTISKVPQ